MTGGASSLDCVRLAVSVFTKALMKFWTETYLYFRSLSLQLMSHKEAFSSHRTP